MNIGEYLKHLRTEYGYTQTETAQKIGVTQQTYAKWENGCRNPKPDTLSKIAEAYGLPSNYFVMEQARQQFPSGKRLAAADLRLPGKSAGTG